MSTAVTTVRARSHAVSSAQAERRYYLIAGCLILIAVAAGFRHFYLAGRAVDGGPVTQQIAALVALHGTLMTCWILLFIVQSGLIVRGNRKLHMSLGVGVAILAGLILVVGTITALSSIHFTPAAADPPWGPHRFLVVPLTALCGFGLLVGLGLINRRKPAVHRPMMLLGTLSAAGAGIDRIPAFTNPLFGASHGSLFVTIFGTVLIAGALLGLLKAAITRRWGGDFVIAYVLLAVVSVLGPAVSATAWWPHFAAWITLTR